MLALRVGLGLCAMHGLMIAPVKAQPQPAPNKILSAEEDDRQAFQSVLKQVRALEDTKPEAALALLEKFGQSRPTMNAGVRVSVLTAAANLALDKLGDKERALKIANQSLSEVKNSAPEADQPFLMLRANFAKARILKMSGQSDEAETMVGNAESWEQSALLVDSADGFERSYGEAALGFLVDIYRKSDRMGVAATKLEEVVRLSPGALVNQRSESANLVFRIADALIEADKPTEALPWAKLSFLLADFDNKSIAKSNRLLARAWAKAGDLDSMRDFTAAQSGEGTTNPLGKVALPTLIAEPAIQAALKQQIVQIKQGGAARNHDLIGAYLLTDQNRAAMALAQEIWLKDPQSAAGMQQVGRVLKFVDGNTDRGNAFISYVNGTGGTNPIPAFMKEQDAKPAV